MLYKYNSSILCNTLSYFQKFLDAWEKTKTENFNKFISNNAFIQLSQSFLQARFFFFQFLFNFSYLGRSIEISFFFFI